MNRRARGDDTSQKLWFGLLDTFVQRQRAHKMEMLSATSAGKVSGPTSASPVSKGTMKANLTQRMHKLLTGFIQDILKAMTGNVALQV